MKSNEFNSQTNQCLCNAMRDAWNSQYNELTLPILTKHLFQLPRIQDILTIGLKMPPEKLSKLFKDLQSMIDADLTRHRVDEDREYIPEDIVMNEDKLPDLSYSKNVKELIQRARTILTNSHGVNNGVGIGEDQLIRAVLSLTSTEVHALLTRYDIARYNVQNYVLHNNTVDSSEADDASRLETAGSPSEDRPSDKDNVSALEKYAVNLCAEGNHSPVYGQEDKIKRLANTLKRKSKSNPIIVGEPGIGKTALVEGLADCIVKGDVPNALKNNRVYSLDIGAIIAGTRYRGEMEERIKGVIDEAKKDPLIILFIDEIHVFMQSEGASGGVSDIAQYLKPALSRGDIRCIGATTFEEYRRYFERDAALARRFQVVNAEEPTEEQANEILKKAKGSYEKHHGVVFSDDIIASAIKLSIRYMSTRRLPDKAFDIIDEAGALFGGDEGIYHITNDDLLQVVGSMTRHPVRSTDEMKARLSNFKSLMQTKVIGQDDAIEALRKAFVHHRSGLKEEDATLGNFLFVGPTGVGKTEVVKSAAETLGINLIRLDMSEYKEKHTVSQLIGPPPGYKQSGNGGLLTEKVNQNPHSILLLDEIEKAHHDVYNILLQVMDDGRLTDGMGRQIDFRNVLIVMTSNIGATATDNHGIGFGAQSTSKQEVAKAEVKKHFTPEFLNRITEVVSFSDLSKSVVENIARKFLIRIEGTLKDKCIIVETSQAALDWLVKHGYDKEMGARPMSRLITAEIKQPISEEIVFGKLENGGIVHVDAEGGSLKLEFTSSAELNAQQKKKLLEKSETV